MPTLPWSTSTADLRTLLSDQPNDRLAKRKRIFGKQDGTNITFCTFEFRRVTNFATAGQAPLGLFKNGVSVTAATDDLPSGFFTLSSAPANTDVIEAVYYYQWFQDTELQGFIQNALLWLGLGTDPTQIAGGLIPAALHYAAKDAYYKMALKWRERASSAFQLEDAPRKEAIEAATGFEALVTSSYKMAKEFRDDYYSRQGQANQPYFNTAFGAVRPTTPRR